MGPTSLFDKSFLQSLSIDESVWFDQFYVANISPLFYVETLADLAKEMSCGRTAEQIVKEIASKTPELGGSPNVHHMELFHASLMGQKIAMDGRVIIAGGRPVKSGNKSGVNFDISPEAQAFSRWQNGDYLWIEKEFSKKWRTHLKAMTFDSSSTYAKKLGIEIDQCKNIGDAYEVASKIVSTKGKPYELMEFVLTSLAIPREYHQEIVRRFQLSGFPPFSTFAPYAAHVVKVEVFFHISVSRGFISSERPSNKIDISYLHYLPFCQLFISGDRLHRRVSPLFMRKDQKFIWAPDLKFDLASLNNYYLNFPEKIRNQGIMAFASRPPTDGVFLTAKLWDNLGEKCGPENNIGLPLSNQSNKKLLTYLKGFTEAPRLSPELVDFNPDEADSLSIQRSIKKKKGSWYQIPKDLANG